MAVVEKGPCPAAVVQQSASQVSYLVLVIMAVPTKENEVSKT